MPPTFPVRPKRLLTNVIIRPLTVVLVLAALFYWVSVLRPTSFAGPAQYTVVHGNSMAPTYHDGDLVITQATHSYAVGDIAAYRVPKGEIGAGHIVIHRIVGGSAQAGFDFKGDNNPAVDPWHPTSSDMVGAAWLRLPSAGRVLVFLRQPIIPALGTSILTVFWVMHRRQKKQLVTIPAQTIEATGTPSHPHPTHPALGTDRARVAAGLSRQ